MYYFVLPTPKICSDLSRQLSAHNAQSTAQRHQEQIAVTKMFCSASSDILFSIVILPENLQWVAYLKNERIKDEIKAPKMTSLMIGQVFLTKNMAFLL